MLHHKNQDPLLTSLDKKHLDLSNAKHVDYATIGNLIEQSSCMETLILPTINNKNAEEVLTILNKSTAKNTTLTEIKLNLPAMASAMPGNISVLFKQIQSRLKRNRKRIFAIHGGGNIGLGCMADVVARSPYGYSIIATSSDHFSNTLINMANRYCLRNNSTQQTTACIQNVSMMYSRSAHNIAKLYTQASLLALCLTEEAFLQIVEYIAEALIARYEYDATELKILILMNKINCDQFVREKIAAEIFRQTKHEIYTQKVLAKVKFVPTVVDRIVHKINRKDIIGQMRQQLVAINRLHSAKFLYHYDFVERDILFEQQIEMILATPEKLAKAMLAFNLHFALFNVEQNFSLHVPDVLPEAKRMPMLKSVKNINQFAAIKNRFINGPHAILAWLGGLLGFDTISEAIKHPELAQFIEDMMKYEIAPILSAEYVSISDHDLQNLKKAFIERCATSVADPIKRVARDPLRKLAKGGRIRGVLEICQKKSLSLDTPKLLSGIAAGILYAVKNIDPNDAECQKIRKIYAQNQSYQDVLCYQGPYGDSEFIGFDANKDEKIIYNILEQINLLAKKTA